MLAEISTVTGIGAEHVNKISGASVDTIEGTQGCLSIRESRLYPYCYQSTQQHCCSSSRPWYLDASCRIHWSSKCTAWLWDRNIGRP